MRTRVVVWCSLQQATANRGGCVKVVGSSPTGFSVRDYPVPFGLQASDVKPYHGTKREPVALWDRQFQHLTDERKTNMRKIETHKVNGLNEALEIGVLDEPGHGGACHKYVIYRPLDAFNEELNADPMCHINFQCGPIREHGVNGISGEALLAVVRDRLECFQRGPFACETNQQALEHIVAAMNALHSRTKERVERGVEGTNAK